MPFVQTRYDLRSTKSARGAAGGTARSRSPTLRLSQKVHAINVQDNSDTSKGGTGIDRGDVQAIPPIFRLPQELHEEIILNCTRESFLLTRLVCREFCERNSEVFAQEFMQDLYHDMSTQSISVLERILASEHLRSKIRSITFRPSPGEMRRLTSLNHDQLRRWDRAARLGVHDQINKEPQNQAVSLSQLARVFQTLNSMNLHPSLIWSYLPSGAYPPESLIGQPPRARIDFRSWQYDIPHPQLERLIKAVEKAAFRLTELRIHHSYLRNRGNVDALAWITTLDLTTRFDVYDSPRWGFRAAFCNVLLSCPLLQHLTLRREDSSRFFRYDEDVLKALSHKALISLTLVGGMYDLYLFRELLFNHQKTLKSLTLEDIEVIEQSVQYKGSLRRFFKEIAETYTLDRIRVDGLFYRLNDDTYNDWPLVTFDGTSSRSVTWEGYDAVQAGLESNPFSIYD